MYDLIVKYVETGDPTFLERVDFSRGLRERLCGAAPF